MDEIEERIEELELEMERVIDQVSDMFLGTEEECKKSGGVLQQRMYDFGSRVVGCERCTAEQGKKVEKLERAVEHLEVRVIQLEDENKCLKKFASDLSTAVVQLKRKEDERERRKRKVEDDGGKEPYHAERGLAPVQKVTKVDAEPKEKMMQKKTDKGKVELGSYDAEEEEEWENDDEEEDLYEMDSVPATPMMVHKKKDTPKRKAANMEEDKRGSGAGTPMPKEVPCSPKSVAKSKFSPNEVVYLKKQLVDSAHLKKSVIAEQAIKLPEFQGKTKEQIVQKLKNMSRKPNPPKTV